MSRTLWWKDYQNFSRTIISALQGKFKISFPVKCKCKKNTMLSIHKLFFLLIIIPINLCANDKRNVIVYAKVTIFCWNEIQKQIQFYGNRNNVINTLYKRLSWNGIEIFPSKTFVVKKENAFMQCIIQNYILIYLYFEKEKNCVDKNNTKTNEFQSFDKSWRVCCLTLRNYNK